jgi:hypothetical protein
LNVYVIAFAVESKLDSDAICIGIKTIIVFIAGLGKRGE